MPGIFRVSLPDSIQLGVQMPLASLTNFIRVVHRSFIYPAEMAVTMGKRKKRTILFFTLLCLPSESKDGKGRSGTQKVMGLIIIVIIIGRVICLYINNAQTKT